jgi:tetratricopeptide (TPR) repeat protein
VAEIAEAEGAWEQAIEYYQQTLLLNDGVSSRFLKLAELFTKIGQPETALVAIQEALALEPQNPKYLDNYIEASILVENKKMAEDGFQRLRMVNPENQKLTLFRERIDALPS